MGNPNNKSSSTITSLIVSNTDESSSLQQSNHHLQIDFGDPGRSPPIQNQDNHQVDAFEGRATNDEIKPGTMNLNNHRNSIEEGPNNDSNYQHFVDNNEVNRSYDDDYGIIATEHRHNNQEDSDIALDDSSTDYRHLTTITIPDHNGGRQADGLQKKKSR